MACVSLPDLITASRSGSRAISLWVAAWATTTLLRIVLQVFTEGRPGQVQSTSSFRLILHDPWSIHYIQERFLLRYRPLAASAVFAFLALPPCAVAIRSRVLEIFCFGSCSPFQLEHCTGCNQPQLSASSSRVIPERGFRVRSLYDLWELRQSFPVAPPPECDFTRPLTVLHHQAYARSCRQEIDSHVPFLCLGAVPFCKDGVMAFTRRVRLKLELVSSSRARLA